MSNRGHSALGLCHPGFKFDMLVKSFKDSSVIRCGWLDHFFNSKNSNNAIKLIKLARQKFIRVHIINGPGLNNNRVQPHEITHGYTHKSLVSAIQKNDKRFLDKFRARCKVIGNICAKAPPGTLDLAISPWLEHQPIPAPVFKTLAAIVKEEIPQAAIVDNPVNGGFVPGFLREFHGDQAPRDIDIADLDGIDAEACDVRAFAERHKTAKACFYWTLRDNGFKPKESWLPPERRKSWIGVREMKLARYFIDPMALTAKSPVNPVDIRGLKLANPNDGWKKAFVWKCGEEKAYATALLPAITNFKTVVIKKDGAVIDIGRFRGRYTEDWSNRPIWDFRKHPADLPDNCVLVADNLVGWVLSKPGFRID